MRATGLIVAALLAPSGRLAAQTCPTATILPPVTLCAIAEQAKRNGQTRVYKTAADGEPVEWRSLSELMDMSTVIDAIPIASAPAEADPVSIYIWYKVRVLGRLNGVSSAGSANHDLPPVPGSLLPLAADEVLIRRAGGTSVIDGVTITDNAESPLPMNARILIWLRASSSEAAAHRMFQVQYSTEILPLAPDGHIRGSFGTPFTQRFVPFNSLAELRKLQP